MQYTVAEKIYDEYLYPFASEQLFWSHKISRHDFEVKLAEATTACGGVSDDLLVEVSEERISDYHTLYPFCPNTVHHYIKDLILQMK